MSTIRILCLTTLWIHSVFNAANGLSVGIKRTSAIPYSKKNIMDNQHRCECHQPPQTCLNESVLNTHYADSQCLVNYKPYTYHGKVCVSTDAGTTLVITCPAGTVVKVAQLQRNNSECSTYSYLDRNRKNLCNDSFNCSISTMPADKTKASIYFHCKGSTHILSNGMSTEYNGGTNTTGDDMSTEYYGCNTTQGDDMRADDTSTEYYEIPVYVFIVGGFVGVLLIMSIIVGVLLRRRNQSRNVEKSSKENVRTSMNTTTERQPEPVNNPQANMVISHDAIQMSATHAVNLAILTDESNTYSHLRSTEEDSDVMYDHTIRHNVHNNCDGDYGIAHRRITEDDYDVSGNYLQSLNKKADPVYN